MSVKVSVWLGPISANAEEPGAGIIDGLIRRAYLRERGGTFKLVDFAWLG